jgi:tetratricopeptide (TPR) repeat protein
VDGGDAHRRRFRFRRRQAMGIDSTTCLIASNHFGMLARTQEFSMRAAEIAFAGLVVLTLTACPDKQLHTSIEQMNEGIGKLQDGAHATARQHFEEAVRLYPDNHAAWYYLGRTARDQNDWEKASEAFAEAVKIRKDEPMYQMLLGISLYEDGKNSLAEAYLEKAVELEPNLYQAYWYLGRVYAESERPEEAAQMWSRAAILNPQWGKPFVSLGNLYLSWDMLQEALAVLEQGTQHVAETDELVEVYYSLGLAYDAQKNWDKAIDSYTQSIDKARSANRDNIEAKFQRGLAYLRKGDKEKARPDLEEVSKGSSDQFIKQESNKALMEIVTPAAGAEPTE